MQPQDLFLHPSGVNSTFHGQDLIFQNYIQHMQNVIAAGRIDLSKNGNKAIEANSPYEWRPEHPTQKGVLLIHGLFDSPFSLQDIGKHLYEKGFLVRSILLPGHGTIPGDLLNIHYEEWLKATAYAIKNLQQQVQDVYIAGFSLGGALAIYHVLHQVPVKALLLFAPALKPKRFSAHFLNLLRLIGKFYKAANWYQLVPQSSYAKYEIFSCNAAYQACLLMKKIRVLLSEKKLSMPLFVVTSEDDESVSDQKIINFFIKQKNPKSQLLLYSNNHPNYRDQRIFTKKSNYPEEKILNFSHTSIPISPTNTHYGKSGDYHDFQHYNGKNKLITNIYYGAVIKKTLKKYIIQRLSFNPDFKGMLEKMDEFLESL